MTHFRRWLGFYLLVGLWVGSAVAHFATQLQQVRNMPGPFDWSDFLIDFGASTFENWQSEFLQLAVQSVVTLVLVSKLFPAAEEAQLDTMKQAVREVLEERER